MFKTIKKLIKYPRVTQDYPKKPVNSSLFIGKPVIDKSKCISCQECTLRCPSKAIYMDKDSNIPYINLGECVFCSLCEEICPEGAIKMDTSFELAVRDKNALRGDTIILEDKDITEEEYEIVCGDVKKKIAKLFGRSLNIREVDAGSCNGCDYEINSLSNPFNDIERLGIHFVASPRHADMLLVTGTLTKNMELALLKTYNATPDPKLVVAVGACAISGGIFREAYAAGNGIASVIPVDVFIPGCPPRPQAIIYGILKALSKV